MKVRVCPSCGHPLPEYEVLLDLTRMQQKLFAAVHRAGRAGIRAPALMDALYDGSTRAPDSTNILTVMKHSIQPKLQKHGLKIVCRSGPGSLWRLEPIHVV